MLKLFVVGESSPDPGEWSIWDEYVLVIAADEAEAIKLSERGERECVCEIPMDKPLYLVGMRAPGWDDMPGT